MIWLDYKFSQCISFFSLSLCNIRCHNDLNSFPWEKKNRCRESKMTQKGKSWTKIRQFTISWETLILCFDSMSNSCPPVLILKPNFIIPKCSFLLWIYIARCVHLSHLITEELITTLFLQSRKHCLVLSTGVEVRCLVRADMFILREMVCVCVFPFRL